MQAKNTIIIILILALVGTIGYLLTQDNSDVTVEVEQPTEQPTNIIEESPAPTPEVPSTTEAPKRGPETIIGASVNGNNITAYHFGTGEKEILFIGGVHGGYSWNTASLAYDLIDYLDANPKTVPSDVTITVIPVLNPDGLKSTVGTAGRFENERGLTAKEEARIAGRFNEHDVDLNRNFDCDWSKTSMWQSKEVSGGNTPFSEPEAKALRDYIGNNSPVGAVVWFSAEGKVYPSACNGTPSSESVSLANTFAQASGYTTDDKFDAYTINGDMVNWMAKQGIPAISVLLTDHKQTEWEKNLAGIKAVISSYQK